MTPAARLGPLLRAVGYRTSVLRRLLALDVSDEQFLGDIARRSLYHRAVLARIDDPVSILFELFSFCSPVDRDRVACLDPELLGVLDGLGYLEDVGPVRRRGTVAITEFGGRLFVSDRLFDNDGLGFTSTWPVDGCMPPHASSLELRRSVVGLHSPGRSLLDMGCGTGCQSQLAGGRYERLVGVDISHRSVAYARVNAVLNDVDARYTVGDCTSWTDPDPFERVAFNAPDAATAYAFVNTTLADLLAARGVAQIWFDTEVTARDGSLDGLLRRVITGRERWCVRVRTDPSSPFALSREMLLRRRLPAGSLLADGHGHRAGFFDSLGERGVVEVHSVVLTLRHAAPTGPAAGLSRRG